MSYREALNFFDLDEDYSEKELKKKYYNLAKLNHPDQNQDINEDNMKKINGYYSILSNELKKRELKEFLNNWKANIDKLKEKYQSTLIYELCMRYETRLDDIETMFDATKFKKEFDLKVSKIKQSVVLPKEKEKVIKKIEKYLSGYSIEIKERVTEYIEAVASASSLGEINTLKQKFDTLIHEELIKEKQRINEYKVLKDSFKRALVYKFYDYVTYNSKNILKAHDLLITSFAILNLSTIENINEVSFVLDNIDFNNLDEEINHFRLFYCNMMGKSFSELDNVISNNNQLDIDEKLLNVVLNKYYLYATNKNTKLDKLISNEHLFKETIVSLSKLDEDYQDIILKYIANESFNNILLVLEGIADFYDKNKIYIERETGKICIIKRNNKKVYTMYLDGTLAQTIESEKDIIWKYMPLMKFFMLSEFTNGMEVDEIRYDDKVMLSDYDTCFLYYTSELLLYYEEKDKASFKFLSALSGYNFEISKSSQITRNDYFKKYKDIDKCTEDLMLYIKNELKPKKVEKTL